MDSGPQGADSGPQGADSGPQGGGTGFSDLQALREVAAVRHPALDLLLLQHQFRADLQVLWRRPRRPRPIREGARARRPGGASVGRRPAWPTTC
eukprot:1185611-Prorocentrum_minimum.AAC.2